MLKKIQISFLKLHKKPLACFSQYPLKIYKAAVILSGSGVADGSEIIESASLLVSLSKIGAKIQCYAPNKLQKDVIDHTNGQTLKESRNVLVESARICRGNIKDILELNSKEYQALFLPGGFGAAKNWSNFSDLGPDFIVNEQIERVLLSFYNDKKPIAACCITPIILAKVFGKYQVKLTLGKSTNEWEFAGTIGVAKGFGAQVEELDSKEICVDQINKIITSPAFMKGTAEFHEVYEGINKMVKKANELA